MRRYQPLLLITFFLLVTIVIGSTYLSGYADQQNVDNRKSINVYTTLPIEEISLLTQEYEKNQSVRINLMPLSEEELLERIKTTTDDTSADVIIANTTVLEQAKNNQLLRPYTSEQIDIIPERFKDEKNFWTGIWYDPIVFAANQDFLKTIPKPPTTWNDLTLSTKYRLCLTDFLAAEASANLLYALISVKGESQTFSYLKKIHPQILQYSKFLSTPVRMVGMGEGDIAIATQSETLRYIHNKFPIKIIYPEDGTAFLLTGTALVMGTKHEADATQFMNWLLQNAAQNILDQNNCFFIPTNPETTLYKIYAIQNMILWDNNKHFSISQKNIFLDQWVKTVRLATN